MSLDQYSPVLQRVINEYKQKLEETEQDPSLLFDLARMEIAQWDSETEPFTRNPDAALVEQQVEEWARTHGIWLEGYSEHTNTMGAYLHPETKDPRVLAAINKTYLILFFIDDTISNELQKNLTLEQRQRGEQMMKALFGLLEGNMADSEFGLVNASKDLLKDLYELADPAWLKRFMFALREHLVDTVTDQNKDKIGEQFTVESFLERRNDISGMFVTTWYMEFATGEYLQREALETDHPEALQLCQRLEYLCAIIGGTANEFYSFEKEVVDHLDEFNLIPIMMMNEETLGFMDAVFECMEFLNVHCREFIETSEKLQQLLPTLPEPHRKSIETYLRQAKFVALASWFWELDTDRYERLRSIFKQTQIDWRREQGYGQQLRSGQPMPKRDPQHNETT